jgi:hypothetical protein
MSKKIFNICSILLLILQSGHADFINLVQADKCESILEVFIEEDQIIAILEIGENDYQWFSNVIPQEFFSKGYTGDDRELRWMEFLNHDFILKTGGQVLKGTIQIVEQKSRLQRSKLYTGEMDSAFLENKIIYVEIHYKLKDQISTLSIRPPIQKGSENTFTNIGFVVYHETIPINDLRFLEKEELIHLDWGDPWYSYFENPEISRHHRTSFMSFLYIEPYEVRHEILVRIKDLEDWIDFGYSKNDIIEINEQDKIKQMIGDFLVSRNVVKIDGEALKPIIDRIDFIEVQLSGIQILEIPKPLPYASAIVGIIFAYPDEGIPNEVTVQWDMFNDKIQLIPSMSIGPEGPWPYDLQPSDSILKWTNFLKHYKLPTVTEQKVEAASIHVPVLSIVFLLMTIFTLYRSGWKPNRLSRKRKFLFVLYIFLSIFTYPIGYMAEIPFMEKKTYTTPEAKELISQLLKNTYRAFDFRNEGDIYDRLALCNDDELLQRIYLDTRKSMKIENQGGIEAKVNEVLIKSVNEISDAEEGLNYQSNWIVKGEVGHWGHKHQRINEYNAIIKIRPVSGVWKMHEIDVIEEKRLLQ